MSSIDKFLTQHTAQPDLNKAAKYSPLPSSELALTSQVDFIDEEGWFGPGYNTYVKRFNPTGDPVQDQRILDDLRYQNQGYAMRVLNTAPRFLGTLGAYVGESASVVGGFATDVLLGGVDIAKDLATGREVEWKDFGYTFDNMAISAMETIAEGTKALFPNYASANYQDQGFLDRITSTEFILNELVDGLAFLGSAAVGGAGVLKGMSAGAKALKGLKLTQAVQKEMALIKAAERAGKKLTAFQKVLKATPNAVITAVNGIAEAGTEAHGVKKELMRSYENGEWGTNLTAKEAEIEATERASESFKMNALLLGATGFLETDMLFGKSVLSRANVKDALAGKRITERFITPKVFLNAGNEALQEGIQTSIERYETNLLTGRDEVVPRSRYHKDGWLSGAANVLEEFLDGTRNTAQQSAMFVGALLGGGGSYISSKARENSLNKDFQRLLRNTQTIGDGYNEDYEKLFEEEEIEEPVIDPNTGKQAMKGTTPVTQKIKRFKRDTNGNLVYNNEVIERKLFHLRRDRNTLQEAELAVLRGEDEIGDLVGLTHLARLANFWFNQDHGDLILRAKLEKIAEEETAKAGSSGANTIMLALSKNLDAVDKLKAAYDNIQKDVITNSKNRENEEAFSKKKSAALLYEESKRIFLNRLLNNNNVVPHLNTPLTNNSFYNRFLSFFGISKSPQTQQPTTQQPTTQQPTTQQPTTQQPTTQQPTTQQPTTQQPAPNVPTLKDSIESALKDSAEFSKRLLESDDDVYAEWENLLNEKKGLENPETATQARFNLTKELQSYRDLMLEEGYFKANRDSVLQLIRRHTAETVKRNTKLEDYLNGKLQTQMQSNELFGLTKFLSTLRDLSQANIQQAEQLRADSLAEKRLDLRYIEAEIDSNLLEIQELEDLINELEALAAFVSPDYVEVDFSTLPIELQKEAEALITSLGSEVEEVNFYSNTSVPGVTEYIVSITKTDGKVLIISHVNGKLLPAIEGFNLGIAMSMIFGRKDILSEQKEILALRNEKLAELENSRIKTEDDIALLKTFDFTQNSEEFHMANLSEEDLPAAVKDFLIKKDIEKGKEVLKTETENFSNGIYSVTVLKKMIDYLNLLLKYPSLGANEPEVLQLLADLTTLFNAVDAAFKKQIAEGKKFMDEHENSITEYLNEFSSDPNKPVFIEILTELKRLRDVATNPASDPNDAQLAKDKIAQKLIALNELIHTSVFSDIIEELHDFLIPRGASIDEALTEILTRKSTSAKPLTSAERKDKNKNLLSYHSSYRFFQGLIKGIPFLNTYLISDRIDFKEFEQLVNSMTINDIEFTTVPSQAEFDAFKAKLLAFFNEYRKLRKIEKAINFLNSGVDLTELYKNAPMPTVFPSPQQQVVMEEALAYLTKGRTKEAFVIDGAAGTGKTFLLNQFLGTTKVLTWSPYQHADENLKQTLNVETALGTVEDLIKEVLPSSVSSRDIEGKFDHVKEKVDKILADKAHPLYNMVSQLQIGMPLVVDEIYAADIDTQIVLTALAKDFGAKVILLGDPNQIANLHGLAKYSWGFVTAYTRHATPLSVRFRSFVLPIAATQEAFYGKTSAITEIHTSHNDELGVKGFNDASDLLSDIKTKLKNGVPAADCKVIVSKDLVATYKNEFRNQGIAVEVLSVEESQGREFPYVWVDITKINVNGIVQETAHNKLVYTAVSRGKKYIGYNNAKGSSVDTRTQIISSFDASLTEDTDFKNLLFAANEKTYLELLQRRNAPSSRPIPVLPSLGSPIVPPTVVPLPTTPTVPVTPQRTSLLNSALNKGKIVLNFLKKLKTVIANKINNQTPPPATNNTTTNPPPNNQTTPVPPTTNIPVTNTPIPPTTNTPVPPTTSNQSEIEAKKADIERRRQEDLKNIKPTSTPNNISNFPLLKGTDVVRYIPESIAKKAWEYWDRVFDTGQTLQRAKERGGFGVSEMNEFYPNWKNELPEAKEINAKYDAELKALEQSLKETTKTETTSNQSEIEAKKADIERRRQEELNKANKQIEKTNKKEDRRLKVETYRTLDIGGNPVEVEITTNADGSRLLRARQVNEDGSIEPMAYATERINNKSQATLTNEKLIEGYIGNEDNTLQRTNVDENPNQTHIDKINAKYDAELAALEGNKSTTNDEYKLDYLINKTPIKAGVEELFESNPELAKSVYESLGFNKNVDLSLSLLTTTERILNGTNKKLNYSSNDIITGEETLKEIKGNFNIKHDAGSRFDLYKGDTKIANFKIVTDENDFIIDDISTVRNIRRQGVITFLIRALSRSNEMKHGKTLKIRTNILKQDGKSLLDSLEKKGIGFYTTDDLFQISPTNLFAQITTQQKQQALQLYSQYLDTIFPDSKVEEMDDNLYISVLNQLEQENIIEKDCSGGKLKAKDGLKTTFTKGGKWKIIKDLKGYPTHKEGGVDLTIGKDGVNIKNGNIQFTAKHGLVISAIKAQEGLVETLPVASQYAGDGSLLPDWDKVKTTLNPYNWGVPDYTDKGDFNTAYSTARKEGKEEFLFNGKRYNTDYKGTPQQQLKETGLTNEQITGNKTLKKVYKNTTPYTSILPPLIQGLKGFAGFEDKNRDINVENPIPIAYYLENNQKVFRDLPEEEQKKYKELSKPYFKRADDAWALYTGNPQRFKTFEISNHKPSNSKNKDDYYYSLNKSYPELLEFIEKEGMDLKPGESKQVEEPTKLMLRNFKIGKGKDERGDYISYYDNWNLNPSLEFPIPEQGKPFEIYDRIYIKDYGDGKQKRMYYTDKELLELNLDKKDFDTLALQRELSNRGYELPKSTKSDGSFDGMWGDETKNALLEYRKSQTK